MNEADITMTIVVTSYIVALIGIYVAGWSIIKTMIERARCKNEMPEFNQKFYEESKKKEIGEITAEDLIDAINHCRNDVFKNGERGAVGTGCKPPRGLLTDKDGNQIDCGKWEER